jgi:hypothetical protein
MIAFAAIPIMILIAGPLAAVVCMASYLREKVIMSIVLIIGLNACVLKFPCLAEKLYPKIQDLYESHELRGISEDDERRGKKESETMFYTAIFTSWISPCTLWANNYKCKSYFLLVSSFTSLLSHAILVAFIFIHISSADLSQYDNPPITHCFGSSDNISLRFILDLSFVI